MGLLLAPPKAWTTNSAAGGKSRTQFFHLGRIYRACIHLLRFRACVARVASRPQSPPMLQITWPGTTTPARPSCRRAERPVNASPPRLSNTRFRSSERAIFSARAIATSPPSQPHHSPCSNRRSGRISGAQATPINNKSTDPTNGSVQLPVVSINHPATTGEMMAASADPTFIKPLAVPE